MKYTLAIQRAIKFSVKTHEVYQKQKRKGKDIPYIVHPLCVGIILSLVGASEDVVIAGILHDTIEDSPEYKKVNKKMIQERFGKKVADLVMNVTEPDRSLSWDKRKKEATSHIVKFNRNSLLVKAADTLSNTTELLDDYYKNGTEVFDRFKVSKEKVLRHYLEVIDKILAKWKNIPLKKDLTRMKEELKAIARKENVTCGNKKAP